MFVGFFDNALHRICRQPDKVRSLANQVQSMLRTVFVFSVLGGCLANNLIQIKKILIDVVSQVSNCVICI